MRIDAKRVSQKEEVMRERHAGAVSCDRLQTPAAAVPTVSRRTEVARRCAPFARIARYVGTLEVLAALAILLGSTHPALAGRIGVRVIDDVGEFYDTQTGETFVPRGNNYTRLGPISAPPCFFASSESHVTFAPSAYDGCRSDRVLSHMREEGYNVIRVFLTHQCLDNPVSLSGEYLDNFAHFLGLAQSHGIYVILTTDFPPNTYTFTHEPVPGIENLNSFYLNGNLIVVEQQFWTDLITELSFRDAPLEQVFAYELRNEQYYLKTAKPLSLNSGLVTTANGQTYDMSDSVARQAMMDENLVHFIDSHRSAIRSVDPTALVTCGFHYPFGSGGNHLNRAYYAMLDPAMGGSTADFIDLHCCIDCGADLQWYSDYFEMAGIERKPIVMGELWAQVPRYFTAFEAAEALQAWQVASCAREWDGWLLWTYDTEEQTEFYHGSADCGVVSAALAPSRRPDACAAGPVPAVPDDTDSDGICDSEDRCAGSDDALDTDGDGTPDACDVLPGQDDSADTDDDGICNALDNCPAVANTPQEDVNGNGVGDACDFATCPNDFGAASNGAGGERLSRFGCVPAPAAPAVAGGGSAIRVAFRTLYNTTPGDPDGASVCVPRSLLTSRPPSLTQFEGQTRWLGPPVEIVDDATPAPLNYIGAPLVCTAAEAEVRDWSPTGLAASFGEDADASRIYFFGSAIVPCSVYEVAHCTDPLDELTCSEPVLVFTSRMADAWPPFATAGQPGFTDINTLVNKYKGIPFTPGATPLGGAPEWHTLQKGNVVGDYDVSVVNKKVGFLDIGVAVEGYKGIPYKEPGPCDPGIGLDDCGNACSTAP
jgi:hypothetical protein